MICLDLGIPWLFDPGTFLDRGEIKVLGLLALYNFIGVD
jgi:hypothetical protein